jgi:hypothetical protein
MFQEVMNWFAGLDYFSSFMYVAAMALYIAGFLGAVLPYPGCFVALGGSVCYAVAEGTPYPAWWFWGIMLALDIFQTFYGSVGKEGVGQAKAVVFFLILAAFAAVQQGIARRKERGAI